MPVGGIIVLMNDTKRLNRYLATWEISNPRLLARTGTSDIFLVTRDAETFILKLLSPSETIHQWAPTVAEIIEPHLDPRSA